MQRKALAQTKRVVELAKAIDPSQLRATPRTEADLWSLVRTLVGRVEELSAEVKELRSRVEPTPLEIDPIDEKVAEERVLAYYDERPGELIYPSDVAEALGLDAYMVFEITNKLTAAGKLK